MKRLLLVALVAGCGSPTGGDGGTSIDARLASPDATLPADAAAANDLGRDFAVGKIDCNPLGFAGTHLLDIAWGTGQFAYTSDDGGFGPDDAVVVRFTVPNVAPSSQGGFINAVEFQGPPTQRSGSLSTMPCDFTVGLPEAQCAGATTAFSSDVGPNVGFSVGGTKKCAATLQPGATYYLNLSNFVPTSQVGPQPGLNACSPGPCDMRITLTKPAGT